MRTLTTPCIRAASHRRAAGEAGAVAHVEELKAWRDGLLDKIAPATVNRLCSSICAAFELAAQHDPRIKNRDAWEVGLAGLPDAQEARNVVLPDDKVHAFVAASYANDPPLGFFDTLATTGARPSQAVRLARRGPARPSDKAEADDAEIGQGRRQKSQLEEVRALFGADHRRAGEELKAAARPCADAPLLLQGDGTSWGEVPARTIAATSQVFKAIGEDPDEVTLYCCDIPTSCACCCETFRSG